MPLTLKHCNEEPPIRFKYNARIHWFNPLQCMCYTMSESKYIVCLCEHSSAINKESADILLCFVIHWVSLCMKLKRVPVTEHNRILQHRTTQRMTCLYSFQQTVWHRISTCGPTHACVSVFCYCFFWCLLSRATCLAAVVRVRRLYVM